MQKKKSMFYYSSETKEVKSVKNIFTTLKQELCFVSVLEENVTMTMKQV